MRTEEIARELLDALHASDKPMSAHAISIQQGWPRYTVHRAIDALIYECAVDFTIGMVGKRYVRYFEPVFVGPPEPPQPKPAKQQKVKRDRKSWVKEIREQFATPEKTLTDPWGRPVKGSQDAQ